jgi:hypothetical protein
MIEDLRGERDVVVVGVIDMRLSSLVWSCSPSSIELCCMRHDEEPIGGVTEILR